MKAEDITGKKFGKLTAVEPMETRTKTEGREWLWHCDCGNLTILPVQRVRQGRTKSCGCLSKNTTESQRADITGKKFGRLTAIHPTERRSRGEVVWEFHCDCGNTVLRPQNLVSGGKCKSCGCLGEENQRNMYETKYKRNHVMGTNLAAISASENQMSRYNKTGVKGVFFERSKGCYVAHLGFQGEKYHLRCASFAEARAVRKAMKELHYTFLEWWYSLSEAEKAVWILNYETEKKAQAAAFREKLMCWRAEHPEFFVAEDPDESDETWTCQKN